MKVYQTNEIKNIALLGSSGSGKTTLVEAMLFVNKLKVVSSLFYVILIIRVALCGLKQSYER